MAEIVWYRSLYWRIALGIIALLAILLVLQGLVFLWMTGQMTSLFPNRSPAQFAASMASDLSTSYSENPNFDAQSYVEDRERGFARGFVIVLRDGRVLSSRRVPPPGPLARTARARLYEANGFRMGVDRGPAPGGPVAGGGGPGPGGPNDHGGRFDGPDRSFGGADRGRGRPRPGEDAFGGGAGAGGGPGPGGFGGGPGFQGQAFAAEYSNIVVDGKIFGVVGVPRDPPPMWLVMQEIGPTLGGVALALLGFGTAVAALVIVRPTRRRLHELEEASRAIGGGDSGARAPVSGGDEVTALSRSFNEMAEQLENRTAALETADRTRRQLLADVSHELSTPLSAIRGYVETLQMTDLELDELTRFRYLRIVNDETERLEHIIRDLLDLAKLEGGGATLRVEQVSIAQLLERVRHRHEPVVRDRHITLETEQDPRLSIVAGDQNRLEQALQNLVANAVRHTPYGGHVLVRAEPSEEGVLLSVEDTGPGVPAEHLPRVFDRFYKADVSRTGTDMSGSGLGLSIVQAIASRHGGQVRAMNVPSGGARFEIVLPVRRAS